MPGRFEGMSDAERELFKKIFPEKARKGRGMPAARPRKILNSVHCSGRLPLVRSSARRSMGIKKRKPSLAEGMAFRSKTQRIAGSASCICAERGVDLLKGGLAVVAHGYEGKVVLLHLFVDADGMPLSATP